MMINLVVANFKTGFENDRIPPIIPDDAFPVVENAYFWRGTIKRKRGTSLLGRLERSFTAQSLGSTDGAGSFSVNILTHLTLNSAPQVNSSIDPSTETVFTVTVGADIFTDTTPPTGVLTGSAGGTGTINYQTGDLTLTGAPATTAVTVTFGYFPNLPVLGLEDFQQTNTKSAQSVNFPLLVAFDQSYAYQITQPSGPFYDVTFYKSTKNPFVWNGQNYNQFWSTNWQGSMWVTNANPGFHFKTISGITPGNPTSFHLVAHGLSNNDYVFINEVTGTAGPILNGFSGIVTTAGPDDFTLAVDTTGKAVISPGIALYLTSYAPAFSLTDGIRWYDGDPTKANPPDNKGFVNFSPPLSNDTKPLYLVGAKMIIPFKNRLLFFGTFTADSSGDFQFNPNQVVYSEDGTAYYANPVPANQVVDPGTYFSMVSGKGGDINAPIDEEVIGVGVNQDVLITTFETRALKLISTGDDSFPFTFQTISPELGQNSTFSTIQLDKGILGIGPYGWTLTIETSVQRFDLQILDEVFQVAYKNNGDSRVTAVRDFRNELVYFTVATQTRSTSIYPDTTYVYNYRENNWAQFIENYTHYGNFRSTSGYTWATLPYDTWSNWLSPWNFADTNEKYPHICCGTPQGFVLLREDEALGDDDSNYVQSITLVSTNVTVVSPNHNMRPGDYIIFDGVIGMMNVNGIVTQITQVTDLDTFIVDLIPVPIGTYLGGGTFYRLNRFNVQSKMFSTFWGDGGQCRILSQRFLFDRTTKGQLEVDLFTGQQEGVLKGAANDPQEYPYLPFSNLLSTAPEEFQDPDADRLWHRMSNSFSGDTVQIGFTLSDSQMRNLNIVQSEFRLHAMVITMQPSSVLA